jgi:hypothetical protein
VKNPTPGEKKAAKDVKRSSYADRAAMLRSAQADGRLKEEAVELDELNKDTVYSYASKASKDVDNKHKQLGAQIKAKDVDGANKTAAKMGKRYAGMDRADARLGEASAGSAYAIGMDSAMKSTGDNPPLEKSTIKKAHKIAKGIMKKESTVWNWDEIIEASDEEIDALIETLEGDDLESFVAEFNELTETYKKAPPNETTVKTGKEELVPRAAAEKAFADMHTQVDKDHPFEKDQHDKGVKSQAPTRPGDKRTNEPMKTLKDIRK